MSERGPTLGKGKGLKREKGRGPYIYFALSIIRWLTALWDIDYCLIYALTKEAKSHNSLALIIMESYLTFSIADPTLSPNLANTVFMN